MARVGLIGGLGPESTIDYYRRIIQVWQERAPASAPSIVIDSLDVDLGIRLVQNDRPRLVAYLLESIDRLERAGADFVAMTANTPHVVFEELVTRSNVRLLSIVEVCAEEAGRRGFSAVGLLGTRFTMEAPLYPDVFAKRSITVVAPEDNDRSWLHERYVRELLRGEFRDETRAGVLALVRKLRDGFGVEAIVLGGTELPLLLKTEAVEGLPTLDTTELHVRAIVRRLRSDLVAASNPAKVPGGASVRLAAKTVGVIGSGSECHPELAEPLGKLLASLGVNLLTGGGRGVMETVARAFVDAKPRRGISIGVLPCKEGDPTGRPAGYPNPYVQLAVATHLPSRGRNGHLASSRNHLNILNADAVVALPGSHGTESELRLALQYGRPVVIYCRDRSSVVHLPQSVVRLYSLREVEEYLTAVLHSGTGGSDDMAGAPGNR